MEKRARRKESPSRTQPNLCRDAFFVKRSEKESLTTTARGLFFPPSFESHVAR